MKLECYAMVPEPPPLVPAQPLRDWMDATPERFAYRCLPLSIANTHGWEVLSPCSFEIEWNGGPAVEDIVFRTLDAFPWLNSLVISHFRSGIVTFHTGYMFRTEPGWNMLVGGPFNRPKDGIASLTGVVETDWLPFPFTMNWRFTRPGIVRWDKGEPFCMVFPVRQGVLEQIQPTIHDIEDNPALKTEYEAWRDSRSEFLAKLNTRDAETMKQAWQRHYFLGKKATTGEQVPTHASKVRLDAPVDLRRRKTAVGSAAADLAQATAKVSPAAAAGEVSAWPLSRLAMQEATRAEPLQEAQPAIAPDSKKP